MRDETAKLKRLTIWFCLNLVIFITCYLNYRLQLKHRYLYKTLNVGLCFSRAAAMVINFNLLLVWLPMCKYSLTRLACLATGQLRRLKQERQVQVNSKQQQVNDNSNTYVQQELRFNETKLSRLVRKMKTALDSTIWKLRFWLIESKITTINSFLISVDHCTSLHTICATTITIASVTHTLAHLMNVINFSKNFDPLLDNLNMAEYKGQNPLQLLVSVPGITGSLMIIILILMSLSSVDIIRNSSYDLFRIFHRLSVIFVILLFLHPFSHVLKEQSNVDRHHPEFCYDKMVSTTLSTSNQYPSLDNGTQMQVAHAKGNLTQIPDLATTLTLPASFSSRQHENIDHQGRDKQSSTTRGPHNSQSSVNKATTTTTTTDLNDFRISQRNDVKVTTKPTLTTFSHLTRLQRSADSLYDHHEVANHLTRHQNSSGSEGMIEETITRQDDDVYIEGSGRLCLDSRPFFVAQSSICWYVLSAGLSCYILDLLLRKWRRAKSPIQLLEVRSDCEGNLIELILSNNHKRFSHWLPGQFVYLNCPQIATYEWHPFTISSMDNSSRQFTLHIKTGGDWTRKLRKKLEHRQNSMSLLPAPLTASTTQVVPGQQCLIEIEPGSIVRSNFHLDIPILPNLDCYSKKGELQIECTKVSRFAPEYNEQYERDCCFNTRLADKQQVYSICSNSPADSTTTNITTSPDEHLNLYVDGPFHSPFERLLEQQVSVCIASGVGWTAFSSVFQCITNNFNNTSNHLASNLEDPKDWWTQWRKFYIINNFIPTNDASAAASANIQKLSDTKLHLMVIVTSIEQLKPFYYLALNYFRCINSECQLKADSHLSPVRAITAFITRSAIGDSSVREFCQAENIVSLDNQNLIKVNEVFTIQFGKPNFDIYLNSFSKNSNDQKISVYCCGSYLVKKAVREVCHNLNKMYKCSGQPFYSFHEESF